MWWVEGFSVKTSVICRAEAWTSLDLDAEGVKLEYIRGCQSSCPCDVYSEILGKGMKL